MNWFVKFSQVNGMNELISAITLSLRKIVQNPSQLQFEVTNILNNPQVQNLVMQPDTLQQAFVTAAQSIKSGGQEAAAQAIDQAANMLFGAVQKEQQNPSQSGYNTPYNIPKTEDIGDIANVVPEAGGEISNMGEGQV